MARQEAITKGIVNRAARKGSDALARIAMRQNRCPVLLGS